MLTVQCTDTSQAQCSHTCSRIDLARADVGCWNNRMAPLAGPSGAGVNAQSQPQQQPAAYTRLYDVMRRWSAAVRVDDKETEIFQVEHEAGKTTC